MFHRQESCRDFWGLGGKVADRSPVKETRYINEGDVTKFGIVKRTRLYVPGDSFHNSATHDESGFLDGT